MSADALAKRLSRNISQRASRSEYRKLGIYDFVKYDRPETNCPVEMALALFFSTSIRSADGAWDRIDCIFCGLIDFLTNESGHSPTRADMVALHAVMTETPLNRDKLEAWCRQTFNY